MGSDDDEEELAQLRAERAARMGGTAASLVRTAACLFEPRMASGKHAANCRSSLQQKVQKGAEPWCRRHGLLCGAAVLTSVLPAACLHL